MRNNRKNDGTFCIKHGLTNHKWYPVWRAMNSRCNNENDLAYPRYGGRGIKVCDNWRYNPLELISWLEQNRYRKGMQLDRVDNDGDYSPENCRVANRSVNCRNRRDNKRYKVHGKMLLTCEVEEKYGIKASTFRARVERYGLSPEKALINKRKLPVNGYEIDGKIMSLDEITDTFGIAKSTFGHRVKRGWDISRAATTPSRRIVKFRS